MNRTAVTGAIMALAALAGLVLACGDSEGPEGIEGLARVRIGELVVDAEVPVGEGLYRGLGGRDGLDDDRGMLFVYAEEGRHVAWMKDMLFAIDIIWLSAAGRVVDIQTAEPEPGVADSQLRRYIPKGDAQSFLEVRAGLAAEKGVRVGDAAQIELP